jgi:peptidyl-dipeptidase A
VTVPLLDRCEARLAPLERAANAAYWDLATNANAEHEQAAEQAAVTYEKTLADPTLEAAAREALAASCDPLDTRRATLLLNATTAKRRSPAVTEQIVALETRLAATFAKYRGDVRGDRLADNAIERILLDCRDLPLRRDAWYAARAVSGDVAADLLRLVRLRNQAATNAGFRDHYALALATDELNEAWLYRFLDQLDDALAGVWQAERARIDADARARLGITTDTPLYGWHYTDRFFQQPTPPVDDPLAAAAGGIDILAAARHYFADLGSPVDQIIDRSDLYPREAKDQHAFQVTIVRGSDIRTLMNIERSPRWLETTLHELGHAVYDAGVDAALPWLLRTHAHTFVTEAVAMLHGRRARDAAFLTRYAGVSAELASHPTNRLVAKRQLLVFAPWVQVMARFERALYADPDQDLAALWWSLVERYQAVRRPDCVHEHDWAAKIHLAIAPVYYHNYLLGEALASQLEAFLRRETGQASPAAAAGCAGPLLRERLFAPGASMRWDDLVTHVTGEPFTPDHLARALAS